MEGIWVEGVESQGGSIFFDCTTGGPRNLGQFRRYDEGREVLTLVFVLTNRQQLENPDNITLSSRRETSSSAKTARPSSSSAG